MLVVVDSSLIMALRSRPLFSCFRELIGLVLTSSALTDDVLPSDRWGQKKKVSHSRLIVRFRTWQICQIEHVQTILFKLRFLAFFCCLH